MVEEILQNYRVKSLIITQPCNVIFSEGFLLYLLNDLKFFLNFNTLLK